MRKSMNLLVVHKARLMAAILNDKTFFCVFKLQYHSHITIIQSYVSLKLGNVQLAVRLTT